MEAALKSLSDFFGGLWGGFRRCGFKVSFGVLGRGCRHPTTPTPGLTDHGTGQPVLRGEVLVSGVGPCFSETVGSSGQVQTISKRPQPLRHHIDVPCRPCAYAKPGSQEVLQLCRRQLGDFHVREKPVT